LRRKFLASEEGAGYGLEVDEDQDGEQLDDYDDEEEIMNAQMYL
jgi:hypothetical protein